MKIHFLTFSNTSYMNTERIISEAKKFPFDTLQSISEFDIQEFFNKHLNFINRNKSGFGLWIWKPKIILDKLNLIDDGDVLVYCDAGMHLNSKGLTRYIEYIDILESKDMLTFSLNDGYFAQQWVKRQAIDFYYPEFASRRDKYCYAGIIMLKKTKSTINLIEDWLGLCERYELIDKSPSFLPEYSGFIGQDADNGLFNLCLVKKSISHYVYPDETNIYLPNGMQNYSANSEDWGVMDNFPFQCRRIRT